MRANVRFGASIILLAMSTLSLGCSKKGPECKALIGSMNELGAKLSETQKVTGNNDSKPEQITAALRPFAVAAKAAGDKLAADEFTVPDLKKTATDASAAALALAANSTSMADLAEQLNGLDAAGKAIDEQKKIVDSAEAEIKKICEADSSRCTEVGKVLVKFPPPPAKAEDPKVVAEWSAKLNAWATELAKVEIKDAALKGHVSNYDKGWTKFAGAMTTLVNATEVAKKYDEATKLFNAQIDAANKAVAETNNLCKS